MILLPGDEVCYDNRGFDYTRENEFATEKRGEKVAVIAAGDFYPLGEKTAELINSELGFTPTLINPRFVSGIDEVTLEELKKNHKLVITLEDGIKEGGFGQKIASFYGDSGMLVKNYGLEKKFYDRYNPDELLSDLGMTPEQITAYVKKVLK